MVKVVPSPFENKTASEKKNDHLEMLSKFHFCVFMESLCIKLMQLVFKLLNLFQISKLPGLILDTLNSFSLVLVPRTKKQHLDTRFCPKNPQIEELYFVFDL